MRINKVPQFHTIFFWEKKNELLNRKHNEHVPKEIGSSPVTEHEIGTLVHLGCYDKILLTGWLVNNRYIFPIIPGACGSKLKANSVSVV